MGIFYQFDFSENPFKLSVFALPGSHAALTLKQN